MPAISNNFRVQTYRHASQFPRDVLFALRKDPRANILFAGIEKAHNREADNVLAQHEEFWIILFTDKPGSPCFDFIISCTRGPVGDYPIFIHSEKSVDDLDQDFLDPRMFRLVQELDNSISSRRRVYSVFAPEPVSLSFARCWTERTQIQRIPEPYYDAKFSYCTSEDLAPPSSPSSSCCIRKAELKDIPQVAELCKGFSIESPPFVLDDAGASREATTLIHAGQVWVLEANRDQRPTIACIVCLTRNTSTVAAVTKVYTPPTFRQRGYARRLVRHVTNDLLNKGKQYVVLYVGKGNPAAHVYHRVGFRGLNPNCEERVPLVEPWLELGFDREEVDLGQW